MHYEPCSGVLVFIATKLIEVAKKTKMKLSVKVEAKISLGGIMIKLKSKPMLRKLYPAVTRADVASRVKVQ